MTPRILVGCEFSGIVRDAFRARGVDAWSCDLLPSERPGPHIQGDVVEVASWGIWTLGIFHPPCTYLANSGVRWLYGGKGTTIDPVRWADMVAAAELFAQLLDAPIPRVVVENPVMHRYGRLVILGAAQTAADVELQTVQPYHFGHGETKASRLWLRNVPPLVPTDIVDGRAPRVHHASPGPDRWKVRSRTLPGMAAAMAAQWSDLG